MGVIVPLRFMLPGKDSNLDRCANRLARDRARGGWLPIFESGSKESVMKRTSLEVLSCPHCHGELNYIGASEASIRSGFLACPRCKLEFKVIDGIHHFIEPENLTGFNRRFARMYDRFSWGYRLGSRAGITLIGMNEETARREITDRLQFRGGKVLEVSIGPGLNLPYLVNRSDVGEIFGLDISLG
jgi:uncharacterized protein YbaR (Trm112 family)